MTQRGSGATTVIRAYGVLAAILDEAVKDKLLASNPARCEAAPQEAEATRLPHGLAGVAARGGGRG